MIFLNDLASHLERLEAVFQKLEQARLKLKPSKCKLFHGQITYLEYIISAQGIGKIDAIKKWPTPATITEVQSFLGFMGYYCQFIPMFAQIAQTLHELVSSGNRDKKQAAITWNDRCQQSFNDLKYLCTTVPIFAYADFTKPFKLHKETCKAWPGAVLYQTHDDGTNIIIAYASRSLTRAETHYPTHKLEFFTLKWAMVEKFHEYLCGSAFNVYTDNNPLTYVLTMAKLDAVSHCWVASLPNYNFQLYYRTGKTNIDADALSRVSWPRCVPDTLGTHYQVTATVVQAVQEANLKGPLSPTEAYSCVLHILDPVGDGLQATCMTMDDWCQAQWADPVLGLVITRMQDGTLGKSPFKLTNQP